MPRTIITFGSDHLPWLKSYGVDPLGIMVVIDEPDNEARRQVVESPIGLHFSTSYPYDMKASELKREFGMCEVSLNYAAGGLAIARLELHSCAQSALKKMREAAVDNEFIVDMRCETEFTIVAPEYKLQNEVNKFLLKCDDSDSYGYAHTLTILETIKNWRDEHG